MTLPTPAQFRATRAMLDWSRIELARSAKVSIVTVMRVEGREATRPTAGTGDAMRQALEAAGVRFTNGGDGGVGVTLRP